MTVNRIDLTETEIRARYITPAITKTAGWDVVQIWEEFTLGIIHVAGMKKAPGYIDILTVPFVFCFNGNDLVNDDKQY